MIVSLFVASFLAEYMKKKGENLATREDLQNLVTQMSAVTEATKKIEAEISSGVWDRQKQWELRREVFFDVAREMTKADDALTRLHSVVSVRAEMCGTESGNLQWSTEFNEAAKRWVAAADELDRVKLLAVMVSGVEMNLALNEIGAL